MEEGDFSYLGTTPLACHGDRVSAPPADPTSPLQIADYRRFWLARFLATFATLSVVVLIGYQTYDVLRPRIEQWLGEAVFD